MRILTCLKQVPERDSRYKLNQDGSGVLEEDLVFETNESDLYALEEALRLKESLGGEVAALSLGPDRVSKVLRNALAMGADRAIHLKGKDFERGDAWVTAHAIAAAIALQDFDLVLTGVQSEDMAYAQTGAVLAQILGWSCATIVMEIAYGADTRGIQVKRELESNVFERIELPLPAVLTIQSGSHPIRYATLRGIMQAKKKEYRVLTPADLSLPVDTLGEAAVRVRHHRFLVPQKKKRTVMIEGGAEEAAQMLMDKLVNEVGVI
jgi:electron transfer flavoprotein beta subunit